MMDMTDLVTMLRKVDASHDPAEANALMSEAARIIDDLVRHNRELRETVKALLAPITAPAQSQFHQTSNGFW